MPTRQMRGGRHTLIGMSASALTTAGAARSELRPARKPRRDRMRLVIRMLSFSRTRIGELVLLLPCRATSFHHRCRVRLVGGAVARSGCTQPFSKLAFVDQERELVGDTIRGCWSVIGG